MSFVLVMLYSLSEKQILSTKKEMIPKTAIIPGNLMFCYYLNSDYYNIMSCVSTDYCLIEKRVHHH